LKKPGQAPYAQRAPGAERPLMAFFIARRSQELARTSLGRTEARSPERYDAVRRSNCGVRLAAGHHLHRHGDRCLVTESCDFANTCVSQYHVWPTRSVLL